MIVEGLVKAEGPDDLLDDTLALAFHFDDLHAFNGLIFEGNMLAIYNSSR